MPSPDVVQVMYEYLTEPNSTLWTLVGNRVWHPDAAVYWRNTVAAVLYEVVNAEHAASITRAHMAFRCYGASERHEDALTVAAALRERLHRAPVVRVESGAILSAYESGSSSGFREVDTKWPVATAEYAVVVSL